MSNVISFTPRPTGAPRPRFHLDFDRQSGTARESEVRLYWEASTELHKARIAGDTEAIEEWTEELAAIAVHSDHAMLREASRALLAA